MMEAGDTMFELDLNDTSTDEARIKRQRAIFTLWLAEHIDTLVAHQVIAAMGYKGLVLMLGWSPERFARTFPSYMQRLRLIYSASLNEHRTGWSMVVTEEKQKKQKKKHKKHKNQN